MAVKRVDNRPSHLAVATRDVKRLISTLYQALAEAQRLMQPELFTEVIDHGSQNAQNVSTHVNPVGNAPNGTPVHHTAHKRKAVVANNPDCGGDTTNSAATAGNASSASAKKG